MWIVTYSGNLINEYKIAAIRRDCGEVLASLDNNEVATVAYLSEEEDGEAVMRSLIAALSERDGYVFDVRPLIRHLEAKRQPSTKISDLPFSSRTLHCLERQGIEALEELSSYTEEELLNIRNFGHKSLEEVSVALFARGLSLSQSL